ncbi:MAG: DUF952 domain-containing protein [Crocosphaera sp.]
MIFHITTPKNWQKAQVTKEYKAESLDIEGFIHCSTKSQVIKVANTFYRNHEQLIVLKINTDKLLPTIIWEPPIHPHPHLVNELDNNQNFPHVYGIINIDAVEEIINLYKNDKDLFVDIF